MLVVTIWPIFALICLGFAMSRRGLPGAGFWPAAERLNYVILFPALLVVNLADAPLGDPAIPRLGGTVVAVICVAAAALWAMARLRGLPPGRFGAILQGTIRFNTYLGLALAGSLLGPPGLAKAAVLLAIAVPLVNVLSVLALSGGRAPGLWPLLRPILTNPLIQGCAVGIALSLGGIGLPFGTDRFLGFLAQASLPLGLLCVGAALQPSALRRESVTLAGVSALRLLGMPALACATGVLFGLSPSDVTLVVIFTAIPTAPTAYVLTTQMGGDGRLMAGLVTAQTLAAAATIPLVLALLATG